MTVTHTTSIPPAPRASNEPDQHIPSFTRSPSIPEINDSVPDPVNNASTNSIITSMQPIWGPASPAHIAAATSNESLPVADTSTQQDINVPAGLSQAQNRLPTETSGLKSWLGQPTDLLFDEQFYGWLAQIMNEQNNTPAIQSTPMFDTYFPSMTNMGQPTDGSLNMTYPQLSEEVQNRLMPIWRGISLAVGLTIPDSPNIPQYFSAGWRVLLARFPIVHVATFDIETATASFLSSLISLGAVHSVHDDDRTFAKRLLPIIRAIAVSESLDVPKSRLQTFQAFLFAAITGEHLDTHEQHQAQGMVSHVMSLLRRFGYLLMTGSGEMGNGDRDSQWRLWSEQESKRRTLWLCWMLDIRSVTLGHHFGSRARSPFRMVIELPCRQNCWLASNSFSWAQRLHTSQTIPIVLQRTLTKDWSREWFADDQLDFARLVVVHALAALAWDLAHRDLMLPPELTSEGPNKIAVSLVCGMQSLSQHPSLVTEDLVEPVSPLTAEAYDISAAASLDIFTDLTSLEIFCGVSSVGMIQIVNTSDRLEANGKIRLWLRSPKASQAVLVAADFLKQSIEKSSRWPKSVSHSWTVYFAFLVLWTFSICYTEGSHRANSLNCFDLDTLEAQPSPQALLRQTQKALQYCKQTISYVRTGSKSPFEAEGVRELGRVAMDIIKDSRANIVDDHRRTIRRILDGFTN
ncbi:hypothetical protein C351_00007 [Cryptococcus neoformans c8]|nr:hypothetical protein C353_00007 [Cryptococcus neoformans var. grubii AD1-83a]OXG69699.1 hypothetical protein C351_00007 [Cryptococcus neoformans var. grubii c8]OXG70916.1 hypothetical protein C354_00006 [Cryptococcus neoformans var. grubii MW-RSA1955]OXG74073.1 hypothetical protein C352_00006 [Cryptococcus neoformans var. grubii CHC193]OXH20131.1 hypothetical protein C369_00006 [Cryptococcus neoformans var. grubii A5-35-17]OXH21117.1 hypothetical protein C370_00006 [Cryptococcus neoformans 